MYHHTNIFELNFFSMYFQVSLEFESKNDDLQMHFPITIATVPFRIPNSNTQPNIYYGKILTSISQNFIILGSICGLNSDLHHQSFIFHCTTILLTDVASEHAEGGMYIAPEFLLGQVYDGANQETIVLYRPVYVAVRKPQDADTRSNARTCGSSTPRLNCIQMKKVNL